MENENESMMVDDEIKKGPWSKEEKHELLRALTGKKLGYIEDLKSKFNRSEEDIRRAVNELTKGLSLRPPESNLMDYLTNPQNLARWKQKGIRATDGRKTPRISNNTDKIALHGPIVERYQDLIKKQKPTAYEKAFPKNTTMPPPQQQAKNETINYDKLYAYLNALFNPQEFDPDKIQLNRKERAALRIAMHSMSVCLSAQYYNGLEGFAPLTRNVADMTPPQLLVHQESQHDGQILRQSRPSTQPSDNPTKK
mmetsp:Transcript_11596/g.17150  ORF Transcript_11596/g.17150 Transcript_11596/m.17150 type:complete len:253 (-) Transcript_11596:33-791(-)